MVGKSAVSILGRDGVAVRLEATDFTLSRKASIEFKGARTVNRHRWVRRVS